MPPQLGGKPDCIARPLQHLSQGDVMAEVSPSTPPAWSQLNFLLCCTVSAGGQFIRQSRSRRMLGEAGNSDDRQSLCHLPQLLVTDVLFISKSAMKMLTSIRNMFNDKFSSFEICWLKDEEPQACHECTQGCLQKTAMSMYLQLPAKLEILLIRKAHLGISNPIKPCSLATN